MHLHSAAIIGIWALAQLACAQVVLVPFLGDELGLQARDIVPEIDLHNKDTRCNPSNMNEVQRFDGKTWIPHYTCPHPQSCKDVNGIGACHIGNGVYQVPAANESTIRSGGQIPQPPWQPNDRCNPNNASQSLGWNGTAWYLNGVCTAPFVCHDFEPDQGFTICAPPNSINSKTVVLPAPVTGPDSGVTSGVYLSEDSLDSDDSDSDYTPNVDTQVVGHTYSRRSSPNSPELYAPCLRSQWHSHACDDADDENVIWCNGTHWDILATCGARGCCGTLDTGAPSCTAGTYGKDTTCKFTFSDAFRQDHVETDLLETSDDNLVHFYPRLAKPCSKSQLGTYRTVPQFEGEDEGKGEDEMTPSTQVLEVCHNDGQDTFWDRPGWAYDESVRRDHFQ
ncbi:hypothetical protein P154DRAFT_213426 [Amniculicola lignicola CBS 123094]|uniref:Osmotin, thaumatin-like protein n=1 Tax=Amniculicola lignicola CBS 123094 TaxID=1392246 RepID=A0A6A5WQ98_9PLEO|nr:hypothetical protein P154DRAFT_213426 [Amniculicola lignicola CBS 123094]